MGLYSAGGFWDGWGTCEYVWCVFVCADGGEVMSLLITPYPFSPSERAARTIINITHPPPALILPSVHTVQSVSPHKSLWRMQLLEFAPCFAFVCVLPSKSIMKDDHVYTIN